MVFDSKSHDLDGDLSRRKWLALISGGAAAGLAGCSGGGDGGDGGSDGGGGTEGAPTTTVNPADLPPVHFVTSYNNDAWQTKWEDDLVPAFQEETSVEVNLEYTGLSGQQVPRLSQLIQSGDPPTVATTAFNQLADVWSRDGLVDVSDVVEEVTAVSGDIVNEPFNRDGQIWQVPHGAYSATFLYREDVYEELGLDVPESFQDVLENARVIDESDMDIRGYGLPGKKTGKAQEDFEFYLAQMGVPPFGVQWKDPDAQNEVEVAWPKEEVVTLLEFFKDLSQYSPDPTGIGWGASISDWIGGRFAQQHMANFWAAGLAGAAGVDQVANGSWLAPLPRWHEGGVTKDDVWLYSPTPHGHSVFANSENIPGGKMFLKWLYADSAEQTAEMYRTDPTRFIPNYSSVVETDTYQNFEHFQDYPRHLEATKKIQNEIVGEYYGNVPESNFLQKSPVALYVRRFYFKAEMVNLVVTDTATPEEAYEFALEELEKRVQEGKERFGSG